MNEYTAAVREGEWFSAGQYHRSYRYRVDVYYADQVVGVFFVDNLTEVPALAEEVAKQRKFPTQQFNLTLV